MRTIDEILNVLNDEQKQLLADTINFGWWGDGSGSVLFIRDGLDIQFEEWAKNYNKI